MKFETAIEILKTSAADVQSVESFRHWVRSELRAIFPHGALACGHGYTHAAGVTADYIVLVDFPPEHLEQICNPAGGIETPLLRRWISRREPVSFDPQTPADLADIPPSWLMYFKANDLRNAIVHAVLDEASCIGTYFSFHRLPVMGVRTQLKATLEIAPLMHTTLMRVICNVERADRTRRPLWGRLEGREIEVASWVGRGKTNLEISVALGQSENTIKHRITRILRRLNLQNRSQLAVLVEKFPPGTSARGVKML